MRLLRLLLLLLLLLLLVVVVKIFYIIFIWTKNSKDVRWETIIYTCMLFLVFIYWIWRNWRETFKFFSTDLPNRVKDNLWWLFVCIFMFVLFKSSTCMRLWRIPWILRIHDCARSPQKLMQLWIILIHTIISNSDNNL